MKEHPLIQTSEEVRAILDGKRMQFRKVIKPQPSSHLKSGKNGSWLTFVPNDKWDDNHLWKCPYGTPGDRLLVRETWCNGDVVCGDHHPLDPEPLYVEQTGSKEIIYKQDMIDSGVCIEEVIWRSPIHMPRWVSRILLEITDVRVERLQDISVSDVKEEGFRNCTDIGWNYCFGQTWNKLNTKKGHPWDSNPWVWCLTFKQISERR